MTAYHADAIVGAIGYPAQGVAGLLGYLVVWVLRQVHQLQTIVAEGQISDWNRQDLRNP